MQSFRSILIWLGIFTGIALGFVILIYFASSLFSSGVKTPIEKQLAAIRVEDSALAYSYTTPAFQETTSFETFKNSLMLIADSEITNQLLLRSRDQS